MRSKNWHNWILLSCALILFGGCSEDEEKPPREVYHGRFTTIRYSMGLTRTDSVIFTYDDGAYSFNHLDDATRLCNSSGEAIDFGTNQVIFTPNAVASTQTCDSLRVPRGEFDTFFRAGPGYDSLVMLNNDSAANDIDYDIRLIRTK